MFCKSNNIISEWRLRTEGLSFLGGRHEKQCYNSVDFHHCLYIMWRLPVSEFHWKKLTSTEHSIPMRKREAGTKAIVSYYRKFEILVEAC